MTGIDSVREGNRLHIGRHWDGAGETELHCPCPKQPCGLVLFGAESPVCGQHQVEKTMRTMHRAKHCPGGGE